MNALALILVMGVAGTGKTTLSRRLVRQLGCVLLDNNFVADSFAQDTRMSPRYRSFRPLIYEILYRVTAENLALGNSVLLDAPHVLQMQDPEWRDSIAELAAGHRAELVILRCLCSERRLRQRIERRGEARDRWKLENWDLFLAREPMRVPIPFPHLDVDTEQAPEEVLATALAYVRERTGGTL